MSFKPLGYAVAGGALSLLAACGGGVSASVSGEGFSYGFTVDDAKPTGDSKYMGNSRAGTKYWGVTASLHNVKTSDGSGISPPSLFAGVPVEQTAVTPPARGGSLGLMHAGSCALGGVNGVLSGKGKNGIGGDRTVAGIPDELCLFSMLYDSGDDGGKKLTYVSDGGFSGDGLKDPVYFVASSTVIGQASGGWTELKS